MSKPKQGVTGGYSPRTLAARTISKTWRASATVGGGRGLVWVAFLGVVFLGFLIGGAVAGNATGSLLFLVAFVGVALRWWFGLRHRIALRASGLDRIDAMSGIEFEQYVAAVLQGLGYTGVTFTKTTGDFGVDLIATKGTGKIAVQCKRQAAPVGIAAIQQVVAGAAMYHCTATMVATNRLFTPAAQKLAAKHRVELVDRVRLERLVLSARPRQTLRSAKPSSQEDVFEQARRTPSKSMVLWNEEGCNDTKVMSGDSVSRSAELWDYAQVQKRVDLVAAQHKLKPVNMQDRAVKKGLKPLIDRARSENWEVLQSWISEDGRILITVVRYA